MIAARIAARSVRRRPGQAALIAIAIVAAAAFAATALLLATNARGTLVAFGMSTPSAADAVVIPRGELDGPTASSIADRGRALPGVTQVVVEYAGNAEVQAGGITTVWSLTSDPGSGPLSTVPEVSAGTAPGIGEVVLGARSAERAGLSVGDAFVADGVALTVAAVAPVAEFGGDAAVVREEDAAAIESMRPVQLFVAGDVDLDALSTIADDASVMSGDNRRAEEARSVTDTSVGIFGALSVFVGLAVLSALVIVGSTFRVLLTRRASELALLRCVGASRRQVTRSVVLEAACIGLLGGLVGTAIGWAIAWSLVAIARGQGLVSDPFASSPLGLVGCVLLAVVCSVAASRPAAKAAGRTSPVEALGAARSGEARAPRRGARFVIASTLTLAAVASGAAGAVAARTQEFVGLGLTALSGTLVFFALVAVGPFLVSGAALLVRPFARRSTALRLAVSNTRRASRRTAAMTTVLTLGVGLTAALTVGVAGAVDEARSGVERTFPTQALIPVDFVSDPAELVGALSSDPVIDARIEGNDILIDAAPGESSATLRAAVVEVVDSDVQVFWAEDVRAGIEQTILIGQAVGSSMIGVTLLVALIGVGVTLALSVAERRHEIALVRALGVSRSGARRSLAAEAGLAALVATTIGVTVGSVYGALALRALGMPTGTPPVLALVALGAGVLVAAVVAAGVPMRIAGRVTPAIGLATR